MTRIFIFSAHPQIAMEKTKQPEQKAQAIPNILEHVPVPSSVVDFRIGCVAQQKGWNIAAYYQTIPESEGVGGRSAVIVAA
jgi:hypothetical protein